MNKIIIHDEFAALVAERDYLRARLAKARHHKKPYAEMTAAEYRLFMTCLKVRLATPTGGPSPKTCGTPSPSIRRRGAVGSP
jgi:hypothetical protein